ncbi:Protein phosphatase 2C/pyruvate dehydrogenase (lipoamide) phosphatase [Handroanthus impetiginosus]|uniref:protein-serine/threonine phosphatase n=1 Tax=Handroanthus impetiginosus TaxID=429701 RepID=A0A2G9GEA9_9LAMI|nr:Protein phosphatase 2C/pyruvate dehydrogenase (lipoamide) phosphatase [Handroanthus impetiginosus]
MKNWFSNLTSCLSPRHNSDPLGLRDNRMWSEDLRKHAYGEFSLAVVQANLDVEDQSQVEAGRQATFVGVYDGHGGPNASQYVAGHLFDHLNRLSCDAREISENIISNAIAETERGYLDFVRAAASINGGAGPVGGSCCLVGVIWNRRLYVGNLGDSRAVLGVLRENRIQAEQVTEDHNANLDHIRIELQARHLGNPQIVVKNNGRWRVRDILEVTRAIGDFDLKYQELAVGPGFQPYRDSERLGRPYIRDDPQLHGSELEEDCRFVIFASDGLWDWVTNQEAVNIVHKGPREGIARRLAVKAMQNAGKKRRKTYADLKDLNPGQRRNFHDDITVVVVFMDHLDPVADPDFSPITVRGNQPNVVPSNFDF